MQYKPIKSLKIYEEVTEALLEMIRGGRLKPGDKLDSVQQLAEKFQVGRASVREALTALKAMGLVHMKQGEGTYVCEFEPNQISSPLSTAILMNKWDVRNLLEVRRIIEAGTASAAANKATEEDLLLISNALIEMSNTLGDEELGEKADLQFHMAIAQASGNPLLVSLMEHVSGMIVDAMKETRRLVFYSNQTTMEQLYEEHKRIFEAIQERNEDKARKAMLTHLDNLEPIIENCTDQFELIIK
ncbi:FadR/GntR family transcriptional regulator [Neobacillus sp. LXY-4]|uniref:FadR/GntR family transcriptional regulator n=1 Tax=Neobacillus sp. LXY-4 TaxID=3379826 RepID=UPI003EDFD31C